MSDKPDFTFDVTDVEIWDLDKVIPYATNPKEHNDEAVMELVGIIREFGWTYPVLVDEDGVILAGHKRRKAAVVLDLDRVPVLVKRGLTDAQKRAYRIADNKITENSPWNPELLAIELTRLRDEDNLDLDFTGFDPDEVEDLFASLGLVDEEPYSRKIESPIYEPSAEQPAISELFDDAKTRKLIQEIEAADLDEEQKRFLTIAAQRHTVLHFNRIADYYAHAEADLQRLMEDSALVIIDFKRAVELGYIQLTEKIVEMVRDEYGE